MFSTLHVVLFLGVLANFSSSNKVLRTHRHKKRAQQKAVHAGIMTNYGVSGAHAKSADDSLHIIFATCCPTGCNTGDPMPEAASEASSSGLLSQVLVRSALRAGQKGNITHIMVGPCDKDTSATDGWNNLAATNPQLHRHFAPAPSLKDNAVSTTSLAKTWAYHHFAKTGVASDPTITFVILEPDHIFVRPLSIQGISKTYSSNFLFVCM